MPYLLRPDNTTGAGATAPDSVTTRVTGDIDVRLRVLQDDWTPAADRYLFNKSAGPSGNRGWRLILTTGGAINFVWYPAGTAAETAGTSNAMGLTDGTAHWLRVTLLVNNGVGGFDLRFWTADGSLSSPSAGNFTQFGPTENGGNDNTTSIFASTAPTAIAQLAVGGAAGGAGRYYRSQFYSGIDGTTVFDADFSDVSTWNMAQTAITEKANGLTVTLSGNASLVDDTPPSTGNRMGGTGAIRKPPR